MELQTIKKMLRRRAQKGVTMIEYALIAALIAVAAIVALQSLGTEVNNTFSNVQQKMNSANK